MENNIQKKNIYNFFINNYKKDNFSSIQYAKKAYNKLSELTVKGVALTDDQKLNLQELISVEIVHGQYQITRAPPTNIS